MNEFQVFRGSWIPISDRPANQRFLCPFCGEQVRMLPGDPTFPTCPWCLSDLPEAEDFETPEELREIKRGNKAFTNLTYSVDPADHEAKLEKRRQWYADPDNREKTIERNRKYYAENREDILAKQRKKYREDPDRRQRKLESANNYYAENREEICAKQKAKRAADPERFKAYKEKCLGKPMREVEAHIRGVSVDELPRSGFYFGKGVKR